MLEPLRDEELERLDRVHQPARSCLAPVQCAGCIHAWPCPTARLLSDLEAASSSSGFDHVVGRLDAAHRLIETLWARQLPGWSGHSWESPDYGTPDGVREDEVAELHAALARVATS